ncbi:MAG: endonuclease [Gammaproteobacteria bacterium]|nr:MAG: endonuclease [Gammaproteobacteria bacterium]
MSNLNTQHAANEDSTTLRELNLLSYNIQVATGSSRFRHYVTRSWRHVLPHNDSFNNLDLIAKAIKPYDIVALQEADAGSLRSGYTNQTEYIAKQADIPYWWHQTNRQIGRFAHHSNGMLSKLKPLSVSEHKLPGLIPGRGAMVARYGSEEEHITVVVLHLALSRQARMIQLSFIAELIEGEPNVVVMGDFNCTGQSYEVRRFAERTGLMMPEKRHDTFPSWKPMRNIDHILLSPTLKVKKMSALSESTSDHLPISVNIDLPFLLTA